MTVTTYPDLEQGSAEWLEARRGILTASVIGKFITPKTVKVADNDTSRTMTATLVAERITGWIEPTYSNDDMLRGTMIEPIARDWYAETHGVRVDQLGFMVRDLGNGSRLGYSPDGLVGEDGLIEVKAPRPKGHILTVNSDVVPTHHMAQIQAGLFVSGRQWCDFISYVAGLPPFVKRVEVDDRWVTAIAEAVYRFEADASKMQADYTARTQGLPTTERLSFDMEIVI